jgi:hypothetical protein
MPPPARCSRASARPPAHLADTILTENPAPGRGLGGGGFSRRHLVTVLTGIESLCEGITIAAVRDAPGALAQLVRAAQRPARASEALSATVTMTVTVSDGPSG